MTNMITKVMLAPNESLDLTLFTHYPVVGSVKIDGIRAYTKGRYVMSRSNKYIPNVHIQRTLDKFKLVEGLDGELITFTDGKLDPYNTVQSKVMSKEGQPEFKYMVFDQLAKIGDHQTEASDEFQRRYYYLLQYMLSLYPEARNWIAPVYEEELKTREEVESFETHSLTAGWEGVMLRNPHSKYKFGRATLRENIIHKLVQWQTDEAKIEGFEEQLENTNTQDDAGKRTSHQSGMVGKKTLGVILAIDLKTNQLLRIGTGVGLTNELRKEMFDNFGDYKGVTIKYKHKKAGAKDMPRQPIFVGFRDLNID